MIYIVSGDISRYIVLDDVINKIKKENNVNEIKKITNENIDDFFNSFSQNSLFSLFEVYLINNFENLDAKKQVIKFLEKTPYENKALIICVNEKETLIKNILKLKPENIETKINDKIKIDYISKYLNMNDKDKILLFDHFEDNYLLLKNEVEKLNLIFENELITYNDSKKYLFIDPETKYFDITKNIFNKNFDDINEDNFLMIIAMLNKDLINMYMLYKLKLGNSYKEFQNNYTDEIKEIFSNAHPYAIFSKNEFLKKYDSKRIKEIIKKLHNIEVGFKSGIYDKQIVPSLIKSAF